MPLTINLEKLTQDEIELLADIAVFFKTKDIGSTITEIVDFTYRCIEQVYDDPEAMKKLEAIRIEHSKSKNKRIK